VAQPLVGDAAHPGLDDDRAPTYPFRSRLVDSESTVRGLAVITS
jgi:hypothetical protein